MTIDYEINKVLCERFAFLSIALNKHDCKTAVINNQSFTFDEAQSLALFACFNNEQILRALRLGMRVFLMDSCLDRIYTFLSSPGVLEIISHPFFDVFFISDNEMIPSIARKIIPDTCSFVGDDPVFDRLKNCYYDSVLTLCDQGDFFGQKLVNIQKNLLKTSRYFDFTALRNSYLGQEVVILGSGPSLRASIQALKELKDHYILIAAGSSIFLLQEEGIEPDFLVYIDPEPLDFSQKKKLLCDKPLFMSLRSSHSFVEAHKGQKIMVWHECSQLQNWYKNKLGLRNEPIPIGYSAGSMAGAISHYLGFKRAYCVGFDAQEKLDHKRAKEFMHKLSSDEFICTFNLPKKHVKNKNVNSLRESFLIENSVVVALNKEVISSMLLLEDELLHVFSINKSMSATAALLEIALGASLFYKEHLKEQMDLFFYNRCGLDVIIEKGFYAIDAIKKSKTYLSQKHSYI